MSSSCRRLYVAFGAAGTLLGLTPNAQADNWEWLPRIEVGGTYNDNYRMANTADQELEVYGPYIDAQVTAQMISQVSKIQITPHIRTDYFPTDHADQSTDGYLDFDGEHRTQRSDAAALVQYSNQTVIYSELLAATFPGVALGQVLPSQSGVVSVRNREQLTRAVPRYSYDFTQRTHLQLQGEYDHASFSHSGIVGLGQVGYDNYQGTAGLGFDVSPRSILSVSGTGSHFNPQAGSSSDTYGAQLQWNLRQSQVMELYARLGEERTDSQTATLGTVSGNGLTGGAGVDLRYQVTEVTLDVLRSLAPSDAGAEVIDNELRFRVLHAFEPLLSGFVGLHGVQLRSSSSGALAITGQSYVAAEGGVDYQITQSYRLEATYTLTWQRFQSTPTATSNAVSLAIIYQPLSRYEPLPEFTGIPQER